MKIYPHNNISRWPNVLTVAMNRRLIYAILIVIILILIVNFGYSSGVIASLNLVAAIGFGLLLIYKHLKFREYDKTLHDASEKYKQSFDDLTVAADDIKGSSLDW